MSRNSDTRGKTWTPASRQQDGNEATSPTSTAAEKRPRLTLRLAIGMLSAFIVVAVATTTFLITYTQGLAAVEQAGSRYASALVNAARIEMTGYFDVPTNMGLALQKMLHLPWNRLPSDDPTGFDVLDRTAEFLTLAVVNNALAAPTAALVYADGSGASASAMSGSLPAGIVAANVNNCGPLPTTGRCTQKTTLYAMSNMAVRSTQLSPGVDGRVSLFGPSLATAAAFSAFWSGVVVVNSTQGISFSLPPVFAVKNASGYTLGLVTIPLFINQLTDFLRALNTTANTHSFVLDNLLTVVATTYPASLIEIRPANKATANCAISVVLTAGNVTSQAVCRPYAAQFPWAPVAEAALDSELVDPAPGTVLVKQVTVDGSTYFVAAAGVVNSLKLFRISIMLLMPETDILGDIYTSRDIAIIGCAVFLVLVFCASLFITTMLLRPLQRVAEQMLRTGKLSDASSSEETNQRSPFAEIYNLQQAYTTMNTAIQNFTRYVPRDVVKDLMSTGQLCEISMTTMRCTMLFVDIASFTTMCERVPTDELSRLVKSYFEVMSGIVMRHDGLIDKFIGDCIMAVWGAPFSVPNHEVKATLAGLLIDRATRIAPLSSEFDAAGESLAVRVGIATGDVLAGNMGSEDRMSYTVIGDAVNLAARIESLNKAFGTRVVIAEETAAAVEPFFVLRLLMRVAVVGKTASKCLYEVVALRTAADTEAMVALRRSEALALSDDRGSSVSAVSMSSSRRADRDSQRAAALLDAAVALDDGIVTTEQRVHDCDEYSRAVQYFIGLEPSWCVKTLDTLLREGSPLASDKAAMLLRKLCDETGALADFDGVWHPEGK